MPEVWTTAPRTCSSSARADLGSVHHHDTPFANQLHRNCAVVFERPLLGFPSGQRTCEHERMARQFTFRRARRHGEGDRNIRSASRSRQFDVTLHDMGRLRADGARVEHGCRAFTYLRPREAECTVGSAEESDQCGLDQALEVDRDIEMLPAQSGPAAAYARPGAAIHRHNLVDVGIALEQRHPTRIDHPCDASAGNPLERGDRRESVDHIAHRSEPDYQDVHRPASCRVRTRSISSSRRSRSASSSCTALTTGSRPASLEHHAIDARQRSHQFGSSARRQQRFRRIDNYGDEADRPGRGVREAGGREPP